MSKSKSAAKASTKATIKSAKDIAAERVAKKPATSEKEAKAKHSQPVEPEWTVAPESAEAIPQESTTEATPESATPVAENADESNTPTPDAAPTDGATPETSPTPEQPRDKKPRGRFAAMFIADLQALYREKVGRSSGSEHRGYLIWKIREAEKGRITVGPVQARTGTGEPRDMKVLPLSLETTTVEKMDAAWRANGIKNRTSFLRKAIGSYLAHLGATEEAALFATE